MSDHKVGRAPVDTSIVAYVTRVVQSGHNGAHAFAECEERPDLGEISFSINPKKKVWKDKEQPVEGDYVRLDDIRRHRPSKAARAKKKRKKRILYRAYDAKIERA